MTTLVEPVALGAGVGAWFTTRAAGNLSHRRPHLPSALGRARRAVADAVGIDTEDLHLMRQVHGDDVGVVDEETPRGAELRGVDALVTTVPGRALAVQVADCVPVLVAAEGGPVAAIHAGRRGLVAGIVDAALAALTELGAALAGSRAVVGPAIGGCCYEVPAALREQVAAEHPAAASETTWGTPSLDLSAAVRRRLELHGLDVATTPVGCTRCDPQRRWFSHRADPGSGRQLGIVVRAGGGP